MQIDLDALPNDPAILQQMLREVVAATTQQTIALSAENDKLRLLIARLTRHQFGRRSEQLDPDQFQLGLEDIEQTIADNEAAQDAAKEQQRRRRVARPNRNLGALPAHLPRYEVVVDVENRECPCCGGTLHAIDELRTEQLDIAPAQLRVRVTRRPRYACRACEEAVVVVPAPARPYRRRPGHRGAGGARSGKQVLRLPAAVSPSADAGAAGREPGPLDAQQLGGAGLLVADAALRPGARNGAVVQQAVRRRHDTAGARPGARPDQDGSAVVLCGRRPALARPHASGRCLRIFRGSQGRASGGASGQVPRRAAGRRLRWVQADCWRPGGFLGAAGILLDAHAARLLPVPREHKSPLAAEVLARIRDLYAIEAEIRGQSAEHRRQVRQARSRPLVEALHAWLEDHVKRVSAVSDLAKAMRYALRHWPGLVVFLDDGRVEMDTNVVERAIRPHTLTRKNALFAGSDGGARHWAIAMTLIQTAKLNGVDPMAWLADVLERVVSGRTKAHELHTLLPWNWRPPSPVELARAA